MPHILSCQWGLYSRSINECTQYVSKPCLTWMNIFHHTARITLRVLLPSHLVATGTQNSTRRPCRSTIECGLTSKHLDNLNPRNKLADIDGQTHQVKKRARCLEQPYNSGDCDVQGIRDEWALCDWNRVPEHQPILHFFTHIAHAGHRKILPRSQPRPSRFDRSCV